MKYARLIARYFDRLASEAYILNHRLRPRRPYRQPLTHEERFAHEYCFFLHNQLVEIIRATERERAIEVRFSLRSSEHASQFNSLAGDDAIQWLDDNGYARYADELIYRKVAAGLLSDFCHFMYEALTCMRKGKATVSFALLRKPLKDNLFYLEWMLVHPRGFTKVFRSGNIEALDVSKFSRERKEGVVREAAGRTRSGAVIDSEFLYDMRYGKEYVWSFEPVWQQAHHLVTTTRHYKTAHTNFNFVFSDGDALATQTRFMYTFLPIALFHAREVANALFGLFGLIDLPSTFLRALVGLEQCLVGAPDDAREILAAGVAPLGGNLHLICEHCEQMPVMDPDHSRQFFRYGWVSCPQCGRKLYSE